MKLTKTQAAEARDRALSYEANMAVEGMELTPEGRKLADRKSMRRAWAMTKVWPWSRPRCAAA